MTALLLALLACSPAPPTALPASALPTVEGRQVSAGPVRGYLARPIERGQSWPGVLLELEALDAPALARVQAEAEKGSIVLGIEPTTDTAAAFAYLRGLPTVAGAPRVVCLRDPARCVSPTP